jgi:hypothetical protein
MKEMAKTRKHQTTTRLKSRKLGATEDRVGDRTGPGAGYDVDSEASNRPSPPRPAAGRKRGVRP